MILSAITFAFSLLLGIHVLRSDFRSSINRLFFFLTIAIAMWALHAMLSYTTENFLFMKLLFKGTVIWAGIYATLLLHFTIAITSNEKLNHSYVLIILYFPIFLLTILIITSEGYFVNFERAGNFWNYNHPYRSVLLISYLAFWAVCHLLSLALLFSKSRNHPSKHIQKQYALIAWALLVSVILSLLKALVIPVFFSTTPSGGTLSFQMIFVFTIFFLVDRYKFLQTGKIIIETAMRDFPEYAFIILDRNFNIQFLNHEAEDLLGIDLSGGHICNIAKYLESADTILNSIETLLDNPEDLEFSCVGRILSEEGREISVDLKVRTYCDELRGCGNILITCKERELRKKARFKFNLSEREIDVLQYMVNGYSNREIADKLYIAERTVKTHVSHIFQKLGVDNRVKAVLLLKKNGLMTEISSEKEMVLL